MKNETGKPNTQPTQNATSKMNVSIEVEETKQKETQEIEQTQYSQKVKDFKGKAIGFKYITEGFRNLAIAIFILVLIGFAIYTNNPFLLAPEAIPQQVLPEVPRVSPEIHLTV